MKEKTSVSLSTTTLAAIDRLAGKGNSRSAFIERVLQAYIQQNTRNMSHARDLVRLNELADELNAEASDVLDYQSVDE